MRIKLLVLCVFLSVPLFAQDRAVVREDIWVSAVAESNFFSISDLAFGGGAALGYGDGVSFGLRVVFFTDTSEVNSLELNFLLRLYLPSLTGHSGLFVQFNGGPVIFALTNNDFAAPSEIGTVSAGLSVGWRFLLGKNFYLEPAIRAGYPYTVGAGLSAGVHF
jgi:hypothetical protein